MGRRNEHTREEQREMALAAAELLIVREGAQGMSMRQVAKAIGYTVGNLYLLFANQDDLLAAVNERTADSLHAQLREVGAPGDTPRERLQAMAQAYLGFATGNPARFRLLFEHRLPAEMRPRPSAERRIERLFELVGAALTPCLPADAPPERRRLLATALWSGVQGVCHLAVSDKLHWSGGVTAAALCRSLVDTFLDGLAATPAPKLKRQRHSP